VNKVLESDTALVVAPCIFRIKGTNLILFQEDLDMTGPETTFDLTKAVHITFGNNERGELLINHLRACDAPLMFWGTKLTVKTDDLIAQNTVNTELLTNLRGCLSKIVRAR
jgi:hypothetical protein